MNDEQVWLDALAGRAGSAQGSAAEREAERLRAGILARTVAEVASVPAQDIARENELIARARREGLLPASPSAPRAWWATWRGAAAAAALACVALAVGIVVRPWNGNEVVRGATAAVVRIEAGDPPALQRQILDELRRAGVEATGYERLGRHGIDADLPESISAEVERVLQQHGIPVPRDGVLAVEISPRAAE